MVLVLAIGIAYVRFSIEEYSALKIGVPLNIVDYNEYVRAKRPRKKSSRLLCEP